MLSVLTRLLQSLSRLRCLNWLIGCGKGRFSMEIVAVAVLKNRDVKNW